MAASLSLDDARQGLGVSAPIAVLALALGLGSIWALSSEGCTRSSSDRYREPTSEAELSSAGTELFGQRNAYERENAYAAVVRREQVALQSRLDEAVSNTNRELERLGTTGSWNNPFRSRDVPADEARIAELLARKAKLEEDERALLHANERGWDELKANIERDLTDHPTAAPP